MTWLRLMPRLPVATAILGCAVVAAGCATTTSGAAEPADPTTAQRSDPTSQPTSSTSLANSPLDRIDPCELLSAADRAELDVGEGTAKTIAGSKTCLWGKYAEFVIGVGLKADLAFKDADLRGATPARINIGRHEAYKVEETGGAQGTCEVFIVTGTSSFVQVNAGVGLQTQAACVKAVRVAQIIDPKLL
jgi:hypothetical protein